jgi:stress-induced morphogen|tara:strand:+ start:735 stop:992 length:258 start_codon:yes stop_codon:yes gene_type:complete
MQLEEIKKKLLEIPNLMINNVIDNSAKHHGHESVRGSPNKLTHIEILLISNNSGLSRIEIHRVIYKKLNYFINLGLHSIEIKITK